MSLFTLLVRQVFSPHANERIKIYYRRNLEMSAGKLAAQCVHAALALPKASPLQSVVVLSLSDVKFQAAKEAHPEAQIVHDAGLTEVDRGTETVMAFYEEDPTSCPPCPPCRPCSQYKQSIVH